MSTVIQTDETIIPRLEAATERVQRAHKAAASVIFGQDVVIERTLITILSGGHALLIGVPGLAKTLLVETPALVLSRIADLFGVPVSWFFQDVDFGVEDDEELLDDGDSPGIFTVASEDERIQALSECFRSLDLESQQHLLAIAGALSQSGKEWGRD
jgi:hypothetical protein